MGVMGPQGRVRHAFDVREQKGRGKSISMQSGALRKARNQPRKPAASSRYADATWGCACDKVIATCCPPAGYALTRRQPNHRRHMSRMPMRSRSKGRRPAATAGPARRTVGVRLVVDLLQPQWPLSRVFSSESSQCLPPPPSTPHVRTEARKAADRAVVGTAGCSPPRLRPRHGEREGSSGSHAPEAISLAAEPADGFSLS